MAALDGLRILDMTQYEAGTCCTQSLALLGADVVKVEPPGQGDPARGRWRGLEVDTEYFLNWNSNKRSITLDLSRPEGRDLLLRLAPGYDVFIENYGPGVVEKLDIGYEVMRAVNPGIIYVRIKGFGTDGPYALQVHGHGRPVRRRRFLDHRRAGRATDATRSDDGGRGHRHAVRARGGRRLHPADA